MRRRLAAASAVVGAVVLSHHGHHVRPGSAHTASAELLPALPGGRFDPHPSPVEASRDARLEGPVPTAPTTTTEARRVPLPVRVLGPDLGEFEATCFDLRGRTATGTEAGPGTIAVDPGIIPLGTRLHVAGYGDGTALDTGGAVHGRHVDVWMDSAAACREFGVRWVDVEVAA